MSRRMRPLPTTHEWALELLAGLSAGVERGTVSQQQLVSTKQTVLGYGVDPIQVDRVIATQKAPPRAGEVRPSTSLQSLLAEKIAASQ